MIPLCLLRNLIAAITTVATALNECFERVLPSTSSNDAASLDKYKFWNLSVFSLYVSNMFYVDSVGTY